MCWAVPCCADVKCAWFFEENHCCWCISIWNTKWPYHLIYILYFFLYRHFSSNRQKENEHKYQISDAEDEEKVILTFDIIIYLLLVEAYSWFRWRYFSFLVPFPDYLLFVFSLYFNRPESEFIILFRFCFSLSFTFTYKRKPISMALENAFENLNSFSMKNLHKTKMYEEPNQKEM